MTAQGLDQQIGRRRHMASRMRPAVAGAAAIVCATVAATGNAAPAALAAPVSPTPPGILYAYGFDAVTAGTTPNLQPLTGSGFDLRLVGSYSSGMPGLPEASGGGTLAVQFSGTGRPGYAGGTGSRAYTAAVPARLSAADALSVAVVFRTNLPTPIASTLRNSPNIVQSGSFNDTTQVKLQIAKDKKPGCRVKGLLNGARGATVPIYAPAAAPSVADNQFHTVICTKGVDTAGRTTVTLSVDGRDFTTTVGAVGDLVFVAPVQMATNSTAATQSTDQLYGVVDALVWATGASSSEALTTARDYLQGLLTP